MLFRSTARPRGRGRLAALSDGPPVGVSRPEGKRSEGDGLLDSSSDGSCAYGTHTSSCEACRDIFDDTVEGWVLLLMFRCGSSAEVLGDGRLSNDGRVPCDKVILAPPLLIGREKFRDAAALCCGIMDREAEA